MIEARKKTIDGCDYQVTQLPARKANRLLIRLARIVGPPLAVLMEGEKGDVYGQAARLLFDKLDEDTFDELVLLLASMTLADGKALNDGARFDAHFTGKLGSMLKWLAFALEVQFGNFSELLASAAAAAPAAMAKLQSQSPSTSSGSFGDLSSPAS